ncbi:P27 family phage terminase small subunit [Schnuerera sp.]|uniref:P27 family phage terminase small subunit n=1 Tax=Schnuerera sp. TaxID=2794844 RepID=UPI002C3A4BD4|nr:P27 family phage terminase small subunit [Schnuerera sp.]HSH35483.1 P27 family phage terminase small subunit [Schnuerera sp.]
MANKKTKKELTKDERIKKEMRRLKRIYKDMDPDVKKATQSLIENAAFMVVTLEDLQETINREGVISEYQNGANQWGTKKSPEVEIYNTMIKNHMSIIKQLTDLLPKETEVVEEDDGFADFINSRAD